MRLKEELNTILVNAHRPDAEVIERDTERDFYMDGEAAKDYGLVDHVLVPVSDGRRRPDHDRPIE